ncbi:MAG: PIN domain-containing protein [Acidimicrobiia bacterium]|nr:PIN domain-containing protein [Acidimicrobiia bacterium]
MASGSSGSWRPATGTCLRTTRLSVGTPSRARPRRTLDRRRYWPTGRGRRRRRRSPPSRAPRWFDECGESIVVPAPVVVEVCWLVGARGGPEVERGFVAAVARGDPRVEDLTSADYQRCADLIDTYADMDLGVVDAAVIAVAERLGATTIATINQRDFRVVRPVHCEAFDLVP